MERTVFYAVRFYTVIRGGCMAKRNKTQIEQDKRTEHIRLQFTDWLYKQYDVSFLPKYFFINLDKVYKGTYKNLTKPVPVEDLWDMWERKMPYLLKVYDKNCRSGKTLEGMSRINYDMAIILSKYDSYLSWKERQKQAQADETSNNSVTAIDYIKIAQTPVSAPSTAQINVNSILDEI